MSLKSELCRTPGSMSRESSVNAVILMMSAMTPVERTRTYVTWHSENACIKHAEEVDRRDSCRTKNANWRQNCSTWLWLVLVVSPTEMPRVKPVTVSKLNCDQWNILMNCWWIATIIRDIYILQTLRTLETAKMLSRSVRAETRQSRKDDIKRVMHSIDKVLKVLRVLY